MNPRRTVTFIIAIALLSTAASCPPKDLDPGARAAFHAREAVIQLGRLQDTAISLNTTGQLPDDAAIAVVSFTVASLKVVQATPQGWLAPTQVAFAEVRAAVPAPPGSGLESAYLILETFLIVAQGGG